MDGPNASRSDLAGKIARLVEERGWNQEDFARIANLNRHTVREIIKNGTDRRLRNATVSQCAEALGLHVNELRTCRSTSFCRGCTAKSCPKTRAALSA